MTCPTTDLGGRAAELDITIEQGATFDFTFTWRNAPTLSRAVSAITKANPGKVTAQGHTFATGDKIYLSGLKGMAQANNRAYTITVLDADNFTLGVDTSAYAAYVSGGKADNGTPIDLTGSSARMQVRATIASATALIDLTSPTGIVLGGAAGTIRVIITAAAAAALTISEGVYDLEVVAADASVRRLLQGTVTVPKEVTRP